MLKKKKISQNEFIVLHDNYRPLSGLNVPYVNNM